jgi:mono/diheme cytochrome c family protein
MSIVRRLRARVGIVGLAVIALAGLLVVAQAVPYGRAHRNPRPTQPVGFTTAAGERLFAGACGDCHSDDTRWPWYSDIAPVSWLVQHDVTDGRGAFDVSEWDRRQPALAEVVEQVTGGGMPPTQYKLIHAAARLSQAERAALAAEMTRVYRRTPPRLVGGG